MKKRLSKIARESKSSIADIVDFLQLNGFNYAEDPAEEISDDAIELINFNLKAYLNDKRKEKRLSAKEKSNGQVETSTTEIPVELKVVEAASKEKKLVERIMGFTDFEWNYVVARYHGECSQPVKFNLFDEVICELLLVDPLSLQQISSILGFNIEKDPAEKELVSSAISELIKDEMLDGDESLYWLTDIGISYASQGVKFSTFSRTFELYVDTTSNVVVNANKIFSQLKSERLANSIMDLPTTIEGIRALAESQASEVHYPKNGYHLQSAKLISKINFKAKLWIILLENFRDNTLRPFVYDEEQNKIIEELSAALSQNEVVKNEVLNRLIQAEENAIQVTEEQKSPEQIEQEQLLIEKQNELDNAVVELIPAIASEIQKQKRNYDSLEFEVELKRLFDQTSDEMWIISPWIKNATFRRIPFFESYLKKGGRIFVAYSEPENENDIMAYPEPLQKLLELESKYINFYLHQLPAFHYKNVWLKNKGNEHLYYTGSYNILSFFVSQGLRKVRQEKMTRLDWNEEVEMEYIDVLHAFSLKYIQKASDDFKTLCLHVPAKLDKTFLQKLKTIDNTKLTPFIGQGIEKFDQAYKKLEDMKGETLAIYRRKFFEESIEDYRKIINDMVLKPVSQAEKKRMQSEFVALRDEFIDYIDLQLKASSVTDAIDRLKIISVNKKKSRNR